MMQSEYLDRRILVRTLKVVIDALRIQRNYTLVGD